MRPYALKCHGLLWLALRFFEGWDSTLLPPCHPERSETIRKADHFAQSRDLLFAEALFLPQP
jgi:hypothetical protein